MEERRLRYLKIEEEWDAAAARRKAEAEWTRIWKAVGVVPPPE